MLSPLSYAHGFSTKGEDCAKCHNLTKEEATELLKNLNPDLKVLEVKSSPVKAIWEITINAGGQKVVGYIDFSKHYLVTGDIIDLKTKTNITRDRLTEINKVDVSTIPLDDAIVMGDKNAPHKVIVFSDPECPYCAKLHQEMKKVIEKRKDIVFFIKMFPLPIHKGSYDKAKAIVCAKTLAVLDDAFEKKDLPPAKCSSSAVDENMKLASKLGINGTPAIIFPDGRVIPGYMDADALINALEKK
jgi:thiol:disulfide interchange protein DsbC